MVNKYYIAFLLLVSGNVNADLYVGLVGTQSRTEWHNPLSAHTPNATGFYDVSDTSRQQHIVAGFQWKWALVEFGRGRLSEWTAHNYGPIEGRPAPCCDVTQTVTTDYRYVGGGLAVPISRTIDVFALIGRATMRVTNDEFGTTTDGPGHGQSIWMNDTRPINILGAKWRPMEHLALRLEYTMIKNITKGSAGAPIHYTSYNGTAVAMERTAGPDGLFTDTYDVRAIGLGMEILF